MVKDVYANLLCPLTSVGSNKVTGFYVELVEYRDKGNKTR